MKSDSFTFPADQLGLDFSPDQSRAGSRLHRVEIANWGTFDGGPHVFSPCGATAVVCGDNGAGKSTIADVLLTLLVDKGTRHFNSAGGGTRAERDLRSYVSGQYADRTADDPGVLRPPGSTVSVILAVFKNADLGTVVSLAQILWDNRGDGPIDPIHIAYDGELDIRSHLQFESAASVRESLREKKIPFTLSFEEYRQAFFKKLWFPEETEGRRPTHMFNRAIGIKDIPDVNEFVRKYVLEAGDIQARYETLAKEAKDLRHTHTLIVLDELRQAALLQMESTHAAILLAETEHQTLRSEFVLLPLAKLRTRRVLVQVRVDIDKAKLAADREKRAALGRAATEAKAEVARLQTAVGNNNTQRALDDLDREIELLRTLLPSKRARHTEFTAKLAAWGGASDAGDDATRHATFFGRLPSAIELVTKEHRAAAAARDEAHTARTDTKRVLDGLVADITALRQSATNIPPEFDAVRRQLATDLKLPVGKLRFIGEWLRIKPGATLPEPALHRLLRQFALTLVIPAAARARVDAWANSRCLGVDFAYLPDAPPAEIPLAGGAVAGALEKHPDAGDLGDWLIAEVDRRFPHRPVADLPESASGAAWFTPAGLVADDRRRREKSDAIALGDPAARVLGWDNAVKITELEKAAEAARRRHTEAAQEFDQADARRAALERRLEAGRALHDLFADFTALDWRSDELRRGELERQRAALERSAADLHALREQKKAAETRYEDFVSQGGGLDNKLAAAEHALAEWTRELTRLDDDERRESHRLNRPDTAELERRLAAPDLATWDQLARREETRLQEASGEARHRYEQLVLQIKHQAESFANHPQNADKRDAVYSADWKLGGYDAALFAPFANLLDEIRRNNLPKNKEAFARKMRHDMSVHFSEFSRRIEQLTRRIPATLDALNRPLAELEFDHASRSRIRLTWKPTREPAVSEFHTLLDATLLDAIDTDRTEAALLAQFAAIERLLHKLETEPKWADIVLDVRHRYVFETHQWFPDEPDRPPIAMRGARGKSGGEKNRLATTLLAAGIAHQYGLTDGRPQAESFRLVVVDEMFAKTDDEFSKYLLRLFKVFHLQLIIIHPLDAKLHLVKPFVEHYAVVKKRNNRSKLEAFTVAQAEATFLR